MTTSDHDTRGSRRAVLTADTDDGHTPPILNERSNEGEPTGNGSVVSLSANDGDGAQSRDQVREPARLQGSSGSAMELTREILAMGRELGYSGADLQNYVRVESQLLREVSERECQRQLQREDAERQREDAERQAQAQHDEAERQFRLEEMRIQRETPPNVNNNAGRSQNGGHGDEDNFKPKIPYLNDKDDIESWFHQFEHYAADCNLSYEKKASRIVYFLSGKARRIFAKMKPEGARDYHTLKNALYEGFQLNAEEYRSKFRLARKETTDTHKQHIDRLERYLTRWIELDSCDKTAEGLTDLMLREQALETLPPELAIHVKAEILKLPSRLERSPLSTNCIVRSQRRGRISNVL